ncbi:MAG: acetoin utilization protein AcuC [Promethearchaeota archaeon]
MSILKVGLVYSEDFKKYNFGPSHPLRPLRLELTFSLMEKLGLLKNKCLKIIKPRMATYEELKWVHDLEYIEAVKKLSENPNNNSVLGYLYGLGPGDNPIFKGMYEASALICGASLIAAETLWNNEDFNICFNFSGGLHHAMRNRASGFCIFNDIAVAIEKLKRLKKDIRIAYLDIDCHHGDGVQWLYYDDPNVLTISFHESGKFLFPGTGDTKERGEGKGKNFAINFPLLPGTSNKMYLKLFRRCVPKILELYNADVLITQLGVDTHLNDPLTQLGLSISIHKDLAQTIKTCAKEFCNNKWLALGGGGYLMTVVPRTWTIYLGKMLDVELPKDLPEEWIKEVKQKVLNEEIPYYLWDRGDSIERELLANPDIAKKMNSYINELIKLCENEYLPKIK